MTKTAAKSDSPSDVKFLVFDIESVADGELVSKLRYPGQGLSAEEAVARYRAELMAKYDSDFIPYTFQIPIGVAIAKVAADFRLIDLVALDEPQFRPHVMTEHFWRGWEAYNRPTLVSFNGRTFDIAAAGTGRVSLRRRSAGWFNSARRASSSRAIATTSNAHLDLHDVLTNFGATRFTGGLNLAANLLGKPGKMDVQGYMVQDMSTTGSWRRSTTIAAATCSTRTSSFSAAV